MSYNNTMQFRVLAAGPWVELDSFSSAIEEIGRQNFSVANDRTAALTQFNLACVNLRPVSANRRFPAGQVYLNLRDSDWTAKTMQLRAALSYRDPVPVAGQVPAGQQAQQQQQQNGRTFSTFGDALAAFYHSLRTIEEQIARTEGVWDRPRFELRHNWGHIATNVVTMADVRAAVMDTIPLAGLRVGNTVARAQAQAWPTLANTDLVGAAQFALADGTLTLWTDSRVGNHRCRFDFVIQAQTLTPTASTVVATAD